MFIDVTARKKAEEAREMFAAEMNHRVKNIFAITSALVTLSAGSATTKDELVTDLRQRLHALALAHDMVRLDVGKQKKTAQLGDLVGALLKPYANRHSKTERVKISTPRLLVGENSATALSLIVHELATNSIKYGALSNADGAIDIVCSTNDGEIEIIWSESGGPLTSKPLGQPGFGSMLITSSLSHIGGTLSISWPPTGAVITLKITEARLAT